jgi:hypothetical protein
MFQKRIGAALVAFSWVVCLPGVTAPPALGPCNLKGDCKLIDPVEFLDEVGSGSVKIVDQSGAELSFMFGARGVYLRSGEAKIRSQAGSADEKCLLRIFKESLARTYDPKFDKDPGGSGSKRFFEQHAVKHFIRVLERRQPDLRTNLQGGPTIATEWPDPGKVDVT